MDINQQLTQAQCEDIIYSENYYSPVIEYFGNIDLIKQEYEVECLQAINNNFAVIYTPVESKLNELFELYNYRAIPKILGLLDTSNMEASGITRLRRQPYLSLGGQGVIVGFVDTGIDYTHPVFKNADNTTRILSIWDQTDRTGEPPQDLGFGSEYTKEQIDQALQSENPLDLVPTTDELGHGTFMAGIAAGNEDTANDFTGAAPLANLVVVKLKQAKEISRNYFKITKNAVCFSESDIMLGIRYLIDKSSEFAMPLVICFGLGTNSGGHIGRILLAQFLQDIGRTSGRAVVCAAGNEGNAGHHFYSGNVLMDESKDVEVMVDQNENGFFIELWGSIPYLFSIGLISPGGEFISKIPARLGQADTIRFLFEETIVYVDYYIIESQTGDEVIVLRFEAPTPGIWRIRVYNESHIDADFHMWLPIVGFIAEGTYFINSNPEVTICNPANAYTNITTTTYNHNDNSIYINSSRGFTRDGRVKPEITAPGVNIYGPVPGGEFSVRTGSSIAAAHTAGATALLLEWGIVQGNDLEINSLSAARYLIRGARRTNITYPNREWGYGTLDIYQTFANLRTTL